MCTDCCIKFNVISAFWFLFINKLHECISLHNTITVIGASLFQKSAHSLNPLPDDKIIDWSKLKAFADDSIKLAKMMIFVLDRIENIVGKGENTGYQHFLLFPQCFQKAFFSGSLNVGIVW